MAAMVRITCARDIKGFSVLRQGHLAHRKKDNFGRWIDPPLASASYVPSHFAAWEDPSFYVNDINTFATLIGK